MNKLLKGIQLRESGNLAEANAYFIDMVKQYPNDAQVQYQCAWSYDVLSLEKEAAPHYEKAIRLGLPADDEREAYIGFGSTLREIGDYQKSKEILEEGIAKYDDAAMKAFLALTQYNQGEYETAFQMLLQLLLSTSSDSRILLYKKALTAYADALSENN